MNHLSQEYLLIILQVRKSTIFCLYQTSLLFAEQYGFLL
jgi:hypothetical protein